jgi:putative FmdB family regulatory protein
MGPKRDTVSFYFIRERADLRSIRFALYQRPIAGQRAKWLQLGRKNVHFTPQHEVSRVPLYEYQCLPEKHTFEVRQSINDEPVQVCPVCGGPVRRVIHPVGIVFKGSGFYVNDSRKSSSSTSPAPNAKSGESATEGNGSAPSATPPASGEDKPANSKSESTVSPSSDAASSA